MNNSYKETVEKILNKLDIKINGSRPWDIIVHDERLYGRILSPTHGGSLALGESYMDGWWDAKDLDMFFYKLTKKIPDVNSYNIKIVMQALSTLFTNPQDKKHSKEVALMHYDLGNDFYFNMLDKDYMQYTCGYWKNAKNLQEAQKNKLDLVCKKLHLPKISDKKPKVKILELGSGFGGFANFATKHYNCEVHSYNISKEQVEFSKNLNKGLPVKVFLTDYRDAMTQKHKGYFDYIVSIGMMEHVGPKNYKSFMKLADYCLKENGQLFVHTIGRNTSAKMGSGDPWVKKYIFPGGHLPSVSQVTGAAESFFRLEDFHNFGHDYDPTLMAWFHNFDKNWPKFKETYGDRFYRMWKYYLLSCAGAFRSGNISLFQFVFTKGNPDNIYEGVR